MGVNGWVAQAEEPGLPFHAPPTPFSVPVRRGLLTTGMVRRPVYRLFEALSVWYVHPIWPLGAEAGGGAGACQGTGAQSAEASLRLNGSEMAIPTTDL